MPVNLSILRIVFLKKYTIMMMMMMMMMRRKRMRRGILVYRTGIIFMHSFGVNP